MASFHDVRLPDEIERGSSGGPNFSTTIVGMSSGQEQRNVDWSAARAQYDISYGIQSREDYQAVLSFFYARRARGFGFRFKDWSDYRAVQELIGVGDGLEIDFQLARSYETMGPDPYTRRVTRPVDGSVTVYVDGVVADVSIEELGIVRFGAAPADGAIITATFEFDVPVRFDTDQFSLALETSEAGAIGSLNIVELRE